MQSVTPSPPPQFDEPIVYQIGKDIHLRDIKPAQLKKNQALESDYKYFFDHSIIITDAQNRPVIIYLIIPSLPEALMVQILRRIKFGTAPRFGGLANASVKIFGYEPRNVRRKDFCSVARLKQEDPTAHRIIEDLGRQISKYYEKYAPSIFNQHNQITASYVKPEWKIEGTPFTSGIINKNNPLKYHYDGGNFNDVYSNMIAFKKDCEGGYLSIPAFDIGLEIANKSLLFFDGQNIMHGVTPFKLQSTKAYRYTLVYYSLKGMWHCQTLNNELERIKEVKSKRELFRYKLLSKAALTPEEQRMKDSLIKENEHLHNIP